MRHCYYDVGIVGGFIYSGVVSDRGTNDGDAGGDSKCVGSTSSVVAGGDGAGSIRGAATGGDEDITRRVAGG